MNKIWIAPVLIVCAGVARFAVPVIRQSELDSQLLQAISSGAGAGEVRILIRRGADPNAGDASIYDTALDRAIGRTDIYTIRLLLKEGASVQPQGEAHTSPASMLACYFGPRGGLPTSAEYRDLFIDLRSHGANLEEKDSLGYTPLMRAIWSGNVAATKALLALGANAQARNNFGVSCAEMQPQIGVQEQIEIDNLMRAYLAAHPDKRKACPRAPARGLSDLRQQESEQRMCLRRAPPPGQALLRG